MADKKEKDPISGVETTGHEWDGLKELNNPAPRWWLFVFVLCVLWSVGYWVIFPAWPTLSGHTKGLMGWTAHNQLSKTQDELLDMRAKFATRLSQTSLADIRKDPELYEYARQAGLAAFKQNCISCHGAGGQGARGYPNLNDDDWLWGGKLADIEHTIRYGVRSGHEKARLSAMPPWKDILKPDEIQAVATFAGDLHKGDKAEKNAEYLQGQKIFEANCASCHGKDGEGDRTQGSARLKDNIWLYGGDRATLVETITHGRGFVMPVWEGRLPEDALKELAIYVHSLGGGEE